MRTDRKWFPGMMIGHRRYTSQLDPYVDGELPLASVSRVEAHLRECPDCDAHVRLLLAMKSSLGRVMRSYNLA